MKLLVKWYTNHFSVFWHTFFVYVINMSLICHYYVIYYYLRIGITSRITNNCYTNYVVCHLSYINLQKPGSKEWNNAMLEKIRKYNMMK